MSPWFKMTAWTLFLVLIGLLTYKKAWADQQIPDGTVSIGEVTFCKDIASARVVAKAYKSPALALVMKRLGKEKKCGSYQGAFYIFRKVGEENGVEIYEADWAPPGHVYLFQSMPEANPKKEV